MKVVIIVIALFLNFQFLAQKDYGFDIPWKASSDEHILEWFYDNLDPESDSALTILLDSAKVDPKNMKWV